MKKITLLTAILLVCSITILAQEAQQNDKPDETRRFIGQAKIEQQFVTIKIKAGSQLGDFSTLNKPFPNGKTLTGEIVYISEAGFSLKQLSAKQADFVYFDVVSEAKPADKNVVEGGKFRENTTKRIRKVEKVMTPIGTAIMTIPLIITGKIRFCC